MHPQLVERHHLVDLVVRELRDVRLHALGDAGLARAEAHEHHAHEHFELDRLQAELRAVELREGVGRADAAVAAVEVIGPAVVRAGQELGAAAALAADHRVRAVRADVVEGAQRRHPSPRTTKPRAAEELEGDVVAGLRELAHVADDLPATAGTGAPSRARGTPRCDRPRPAACSLSAGSAAGSTGSGARASARTARPPRCAVASHGKHAAEIGAALPPARLRDRTRRPRTGCPATAGR